MNALDRNRYTEAWRTFGTSIPRPRAILVVSAHCYTNLAAVTAMARPRTIQDFYGFPEELFAVEYPAPGAPAFAEQVAEIAKPTMVGLDTDVWGLDHGTWSVLIHVFPEADVPVVHLSIKCAEAVRRPPRAGRQAGAAARPRDARHRQWQRDPHPSARRRGTTGGRVQVGAALRRRRPGSDGHGPRGRGSSAGPHRFRCGGPDTRPLHSPLYIAGLATAAGRPADVLVDRYAMGSLSMTAYSVGMQADTAPDQTDGAPPLPDLPADETTV
jgi:4,5-DOPA dioxygenase extradiol